jgi:hypothetical protein
VIDTLPVLLMGTGEFHADLVQVVGFEPLATSALPTGGREIRVWIYGGITATEDLYRIVSAPGGIRGQWIEFWPTDSVVKLRTDGPGAAQHTEQVTYAEVERHRHAGQCLSFKTSRTVEACVGRLASTVDWSTVLAHLDADSVMTLPDESMRPRGDYVDMLDGYGITVEVKDAARLRRYTFWNPNGAWPPDQRAKDISGVVSQIRTESFR